MSTLAQRRRKKNEAAPSRGGTEPKPRATTARVHGPADLQYRKNLKLYRGIPSGYYHHVMLVGNPVQRTWHREKFLKVIERIDPKWDVLDIGCGPGSLFSLLPERSGRTVGVDLADKQVQFAKNEFRERGFEWYTGGFPRLDFPDKSFDCVLMVELIEHLSQYDLAPYFREAKRLLRPGGRIILTTPNYFSAWPVVETLLGVLSPISYEEQHITKFTPARMRKFLSYLGLTSYRLSTFFVVAPFLAPLGAPLVKETMALEEKLLPGLGQLLMVEIDV